MKQINLYSKTIVIFAMILGFVSVACAVMNTMSAEEAKAFYKKAYEHTILKTQATREDYAHYYAKNFTMIENGKLYNFDAFVRLALERQNDRKSIKIIFKNMLAESDGVATVHTTHIVRKDGSKLDLDVLSFFRLRNHQFISGNEMTKPVAQ